MIERTPSTGIPKKSAEKGVRFNDVVGLCAEDAGASGKHQPCPECGSKDGTSREAIVSESLHSLGLVGTILNRNGGHLKMFMEEECVQLIVLFRWSCAEWWILLREDPADRLLNIPLREWGKKGLSVEIE